MQDGIVEIDEEDALVDTTSANGTFTSALVVALILIFLYFLLLLMNCHDEAMQEARRRLQERFNQTNQRQTSAENAPSSSNVTDGESAKIAEGSRPKPKVKADLLKQSGYNPLMGDDTDKLVGREDNVGGAAEASEATMAFLQKSLLGMTIETVETIEDASEDRPGDV
ncbi:hypothetical protein SprV_0200763200 [Sparganum proliferum]